MLVRPWASSLQRFSPRGSRPEPLDSGLPLLPLIVEQVQRSPCRAPPQRSTTGWSVAPTNRAPPKRSAVDGNGRARRRGGLRTEARGHSTRSGRLAGAEAPAAHRRARTRMGVTSRDTGLRATEAARRHRAARCTERHDTRPCHSQSRQHAHSQAITRTHRPPKRPSSGDDPGHGRHRANAPKHEREGDHTTSPHERTGPKHRRVG